MVQKYEYDQLMGMSQYKYRRHFVSQRKMKVNTMCRPISAIRGLSAEDILELCRQENSVPVDIKTILKKLGISSMAYDFSELEDELEECSDGNHILGALVTKGDKAAIFYSIDDKKDSHRYRFTIAHEIGHCCLKHFPVHGETTHPVFRKDGDTSNKQEIAANIFAGQLLIPRNSLIRIIDELLKPSVSVLAKIFDVSEKVMYARLKHLNIKTKIEGYNC